MNSTQLIETALQDLLVKQEFSSWAVDANGQRAIYKAHDSPDGDYQGSQTKTVRPSILIECASCTPWPTPRSRKRRAIVRITYRSNRDDTGHLTHDARCREIFGVFFDSDTKFLLNDYGSFTACDMRYAGDGSARVGRDLESYIDIQIDFIDADIN